MPLQNVSHRPSRSRRRRRQSPVWRRLLVFVVVVAIPFLSTSSFLPTAQAWEWSDLVSGGVGVGSNNDDNDDNSGSSSIQNWLSRQEIAAMRVRDLKRRLARNHGYGADELAKMLDKKELISALWGEEFKEYSKYKAKRQRKVVIEGIWTALIGVVIVVGWPLWKHVYEVGLVNWQVYSDRKLLEIQKCRDYRSITASMGVLLMIVIDGLQLWLSVSVLLSWVMKSKYFFPMPQLAIRPAQFMGEKAAQGPMGRYGMNVAPMAVTWVMRFLRSRVETFTAKALSGSYQHQKREARANETEEERVARKAARKAAKRAAKEEAAQKEQERLDQQTQFRKEQADQATQQLFGKARPPPPPHQYEQQGQADVPKQSPFQEDEMKEGDDVDDDGFLSDEDNQEEREARREFEADLREVDINDLD